MAQGRNRVKSYKIHKLEPVPEEQWIVVQNTHEPIIDRETFAKAKDLLKRDTRTAPKQKQLYLFSGFLRCADCGRAMSRIASKDLYVYYQCGTYKSLSKKGLHYALDKKYQAGGGYSVRYPAAGTPLRSTILLLLPKSTRHRRKKASLCG